MRRPILTLLLLPGLVLVGFPGRSASPALGADRFVYTMRREVHAVDAGTGAEIPFAVQRFGSKERTTLGVTGRVAIARRTAMVEEGGQVFVFASVPEAMASRPRDLDVMVEGPDGMRVRGSIPFDPKGSRRVARLFVLEDLEPGPARVEVHVRGVQVSDWQEIVTEEVEVPARGRLRFGFGLEGMTGASADVDVVVEARPVAAPGGPGGQSVVLWKKRVSASSTRWEDEVEDLGDLAGQRVRFAVRSRPEGGRDEAAPAVVWGAPAVEVDEKRRAYPLLVLISLDSLRASSVGLYTGGTATPFLDGFFGRQGAVMTEAATQSVTTLPSHMTMMTGLNPLSHGVIDETRSLGADVVTLAEALRARGWHTAAFTEGGALAGEFGFRRGFDLYNEGRSTQIDPRRADAIDRARTWLDEYSGAPLFLFVHTYATRPVHRGVDAARDPSLREAELAAYVRQVRAADEALAGLFATMKGRIDEDRSVYLVTSGHGDEFFEHGAAGHGTHLYDETVRVPMLLRAERIEKTGRHGLSVGLVDVAPTLLHLAGAPAPARMQGRSFAPLLESGRAVLEAPRFTEARRPVRLTSGGTLQLWGPPSYSVRDGRRKVVWNSGGDGSFEAYDLTADPYEQRNLSAQSGTLPWVRRMEVSVRSYPSAAGRTARPGGKAELSPENRSRLESLGYAR